MTFARLFVFGISHAVALAIGFAAGIYALPIIIAPDSPSTEQVAAVEETSMYSAAFQRELQDSDSLHWGEGEVFVARDAISHRGALAPGPDYKLYLSPEYLETEAAFVALKSSMVQVGDVKTFDGFVVPVSSDIDPSDYVAVIVWCETFGEFITAAQYR